MPKQILHDAVVSSSYHILGEDAYAMPMSYADIQHTKLWPTHVNGVEYPLIDWARPYKRGLHSSRFSCMSIWKDNAVKGAIRLGVTKRLDRISVTHLSRDLSCQALDGMMAEMAFGALLIAQQEMAQHLDGKIPQIGVLNPYEKAIPHYIAVAERMNLTAELRNIGRRDKLMYLS